MWPFPPKDRRVFVRPWLALPGLVLGAIFSPVIAGWAWIVDYVFEVEDLGRPGDVARRAKMAD